MTNSLHFYLNQILLSPSICKKKGLKHKLVAFVGMMVLFLTSIAQSYFVDGTNGSDSYSGTQWNTAASTGSFKTIDKALAMAAALASGASINIYVKQNATAYPISATDYIFTNKSLLLQGGFPTAATGTDITGYNAANKTTMTYIGYPPTASIIVNNNAVGPFTVALKGITEGGTLTNRDFFDALSATEANTAFLFTDMTHITGDQFTTYNLQNLAASCSVTFTNCSFNNITSNGGAGTAINITKSAIAPMLTTCTFNNNKPYNGTIYLSQITANPTATIAADCIFTNNVSANLGGVFTLDQNTGAFNLSNITIPISGNKAANYGGVIYHTDQVNYNGNTNITNCTFTNSKANYGGVVFRQDNGTGNITITSSTFNGNSVTTYGGAVFLTYIHGLVTLSNNTFTSNAAPSGYGGAWFQQNTQGGLNLSNCSFTSNTAANGGALFYSAGMGNLNITGSGFCSNSTTDNAGAIYLDGNTGSFLIDNTVMNNNTAVNYGGAFFLNRNNATLGITNSTFSTNTSTGNMGGAIMSDGSNNMCTYTNVVFINNKSLGNSYGGGAILSNNPGTINSCNFTNNSGHGYGGAVYMGQTLTIGGGTIFDGNFTTVSNPGGAFYSQGTTNIDKTVFRNNYINNMPSTKIDAGCDLFAANNTASITNSRVQHSPLSDYGTGSKNGTTTDGNSASFATTTAPTGCTATVLVVLPITLVSFSGVANGCRANLGWQTVMEQNSSYYEVEVSTDGTSFNQIGKLVSHNNSTGSTYSFGYALGSGAHYFRLKAMDFDGKFSYSSIILISGTGACGTAMNVTVSPNPTSNLLNVQGLAIGSRLLLINANGQKMTDVLVRATGQSISLHDYAKGLYVLRIQANDGTVSNVKVIKN